MLDKSYFKTLPDNRRIFGSAHKDRPFIVLKLATSLDGRIAAKTGAGEWITNTLSRAFVHRMRAEADAIMIGTRTAELDDPELTCRLPGLQHLSPIRIILDRQARLPARLKVFATAAASPTWLLSATPPARPLIDLGVNCLEVAETGDGRLDLADALFRIGRQGIQSLLVEGGAQLARTMLQLKLIDRLVWFHAPKLLGSDGIPAIGPLDLSAVEDGPKLKPCETLFFAEDVARIFDLGD